MASRKKALEAPIKLAALTKLSKDLNKATPYIQRIVQDAKLRENVR